MFKKNLRKLFKKMSLNIYNMENICNYEETPQRVCKLCGLPNFIREKKRTCVKCISKKNNARLKATNYYKQYYENNKDAVLKQQQEHYHTVTKVRRLQEKLQN